MNHNGKFSAHSYYEALRVSYGGNVLERVFGMVKFPKCCFVLCG